MCPCGIAPSLVAEIRRYRALLIGLRAAWQFDHTCPFHSGDFSCPEGCTWSELEAEVQAIREERG